MREDTCKRRARRPRACRPVLHRAVEKRSYRCEKFASPRSSANTQRLLPHFKVRVQVFFFFSSHTALPSDTQVHLVLNVGVT